MREIVLDTETTGFEPSEGHRLVEIGCVELVNHVPTGRVWHHYINPQRDMPPEAFEVHGLSAQFLADKPLFRAVAGDFLAFIGEAGLVIHNAAFDMKFLNAELGWAGLPQLPPQRAIDTLAIARKRFPGAPASLDALCRRFGIDNSRREKHGALLDSEILAEVYLELIGGRQPDLVLGGTAAAPGASFGTAEAAWRARPRPKPLPPRLTEAERQAHVEFVAGLGPNAVWLRHGEAPGAAAPDRTAGG
ncbi:MAG: DNA polymerase III subunit epsilon [Mangrovicoccus sp.]|nr:DNA polymerase III subunit epsilon [Mangrovicoccus sp.]